MSGALFPAASAFDEICGFTFFLGILYLQWVINAAAHALANRLPRRKKRRNPPVAPFAR